MNLVLLLILVAYQAVVAIIDARDMKKYAALEITQEHRIKFYKEAIIYGWIPVVIIFAAVAVLPITLEDIGIRSIKLSEIGVVNIITLAMSAILALILIYQAAMYFASEKYRQQVSDEINRQRNCTNQYQAITSSILIPKNIAEKTWFFFVSLTAGICEEIVWRGSVIFLIHSIFPSLHLVVVCAIACALFGLAHYYQGLYGIVKTGVIAMLFVAIYAATNSLLPGIVLHFLFDYSSAFLIREEK